MPTPIEQLLSRTVYDTDGSTTVWDFSFASGYLDPSHVKAYTTDSLGARNEIVVTEPMLIGEFQLQITPALADGLVLTIYRDTPKDAPLVNFVDETSFSELSLDTNAKQAVMVAAEAIDTVNSSDIQGAIEAAESAATAAAEAAASAASVDAAAATATAEADSAIAAAAAAAASAASINPASFATAAQGAKADSALQLTSLSGAAVKATPVDADEFTFLDSAASFVLKRFTWANLKSVLTTALSATFALRGANTDITSLSGLVARGLRFLSTGSIDLASGMPVSGSYVAGDLVLEFTTISRISGWRRLTTGSGHVLNTDWAYFSGNSINRGTAVPTTSGTSVDFTGIPAGVNRITVMLRGCSLSGTSDYMVQLGDSGGVENSGYSGGLNPLSAWFSTGFRVTDVATAAQTLDCVMVLTRIDGNNWMCSFNTGHPASNIARSGAGSKSLSDTLTQVRVTSVNGTDTLDLGSANVFWEF